MPTGLILRQAFVWGAGIGVGIAGVNTAYGAVVNTTEKVATKIRNRKASKA